MISQFNILLFSQAKSLPFPSVFRCDRLNSCSVPVNSDVFGDPCPGTHKYVEIHYTCSPKTSPTTRRPLPPWFVQSPVVPGPAAGGNTDLWMPNSQKTSKELSLEGRKGLTGFSSRIPILVATTTTTPKRIPITTPKPTTASTTTKTTTSTTTTEETQANDANNILEGTIENNNYLVL